ncbi:hypothetical protein QLX08_008465 [Tetragonisca angustula]|uniref:PiggyBac transposable element-derived protein domain-containing protein n=1 Tax=Tetragonisca angustula TaxID=166442 RepID=A0AAW0ZJY6_9HYME
MSKREGLKRKMTPPEDVAGPSGISKTSDPAKKKEKVEVESESSESPETSQTAHTIQTHRSSFSSESSLQSSSREMPLLGFDSDSDEIESETGSAEEDISLPFKFLHITDEGSDEEPEEPSFVPRVVHNFANENPGQANFPFEGMAGFCIFEYPRTPINFFRLLAHDTFLTCIIKRMNLLGDKLKSSALEEEKPCRFRNWQPLTQKEFEKFLAVVYLTGQIKSADLDWYWKKSRIYQCPIFATVIPKERFLEILYVFHIDCGFDDEEIDDPSTQPKPLDIFNKTMKEVYYPSKKLTVDESVISFRSQLYFRQNVSSKKCKYGLKLYTLTEPNGMVLRIHTHLQTKDTDRPDTDEIVRKLISDFLGIGHVVYLDQNFINYAIVKDFLEQKTHTLGMVKKTEPENPVAVVNVVLTPGQVFQQFSPEGICVMKYNPKNTEKDAIMMISTQQSATMELVKSKGKIVERPTMYLDYSLVMEAVERTEQFFMFYPCKRAKKLLMTTKFAIHMFQTILFNSFLLCSRYHRVKFSRFRDSTIKALLRSTVSLDLETSLKRELQRSRIHVPVLVEEDEKKYCVVCLNEGLKRKETKLICPNCSGRPGLCVDKCFRRHHNYH